MSTDLHIHTNLSDGRMSPTEVIEAAIKVGLKNIAITDHDTTKALHILRELNLLNNPHLNIIQGIEFSADQLSNEIHILGYGIDIDNRELQAELANIVVGRKQRVRKMVKKLKALGFDISYEKVMESGKHADSLSRSHIANALVTAGYFEKIGDVFAELLNRNGKGYVPHYKLSCDEIIRLIKVAGGIAVLAHPGLVGDDNLVLDCINKGIQGLEVFHPKHNQAEIGKYLKLAQENNLLITGGSDYHAIPTRYPQQLGMFTLAESYSEVFLQALKKA